jgi:hypothetical protein
VREAGAITNHCTTSSSSIQLKTQRRIQPKHQSIKEAATNKSRPPGSSRSCCSPCFRYWTTLVCPNKLESASRTSGNSATATQHAIGQQAGEVEVRHLCMSCPRRAAAALCLLLLASSVYSQPLRYDAVALARPVDEAPGSTAVAVLAFGARMPRR